MKITKSEIKELALKALSQGNPYIENSIEHYVGTETKYVYRDGEIYTKEELDDEYLKTASKDIEQGFRNRMIGYYDKWFRYNRADEGRAYDLGCQYAVKQDKCSDEMRIIEVNNI